MFNCSKFRVRGSMFSWSRFSIGGCGQALALSSLVSQKLAHVMDSEKIKPDQTKLSQPHFQSELMQQNCLNFPANSDTAGMRSSEKNERHSRHSLRLHIRNDFPLS